MNRKQTRSYTYRVPLDDSRAMRKIHRLKALDSGYDIVELSDREVPNANAVKNWAVKFYQSHERRDYQTKQITGGTIPGFHEYRHSLKWKPTPETENLEMRNANNGGTKIRGHQFVGTHDPRLPDNVPIDTVVPWTPTEIRAMFDGEEVPDRVNYGHNPPMIDAETAIQQYLMEIQAAERESFEELQGKLYEYEENCDHDHAIKDGSEFGDIGYCEDCGRSWNSVKDMNADDATIVGSV